MSLFLSIKSTKEVYEGTRVKNKVRFWLKNTHISLQSLTRYKSQVTDIKSYMANYILT